MWLRRVQLLLEPYQDDGLEQNARALGRSKSNLIRDIIRASPADEELCSLDDDPFFSLMGSIPADGTTDVAEHHDRYLEEAKLGAWHPKGS